MKYLIPLAYLLFLVMGFYIVCIKAHTTSDFVFGISMMSIYTLILASFVYQDVSE